MALCVLPSLPPIRPTTPTAEGPPQPRSPLLQVDTPARLRGAVLLELSKRPEFWALLTHEHSFADAAQRSRALRVLVQAFQQKIRNYQRHQESPPLVRPIPVRATHVCAQRAVRPGRMRELRRKRRCLSQSRHRHQQHHQQSEEWLWHPSTALPWGL